MKICLINTDFAMGGQQKANFELAKILIDNNYEVTLYSFRPTVPFFLYEKFDVVVDKSRVDLTYSDKIKRLFYRKFLVKKGESNPTKEFEQRYLNMLNFLKGNNFDLIVLSGGFLTSFAKKIKENLKEVKVIVWQHSSANVYLEKYYTDIKQHYLFGLKNADAIVCLTKNDSDIFKKYNSSVINIPNATNFPVLQQPKELNRKRKRLLFSSRYDIHTKGLDLFFGIVQQLPDEYVVNFAGGGTDKQIKQVHNLINKLKIEEKINLLGPLDKEEMMEFYNDGDLFISTSRWEGFGLSILEAMSFGLPILSFETSGSIEILENGKYGTIVKNFDINKMGAEIKKILNNEEIYREHSRLSLQRANKYSPAEIFKQWDNLFTSLS